MMKVSNIKVVSVISYLKLFDLFKIYFDNSNVFLKFQNSEKGLEGHCRSHCAVSSRRQSQINLCYIWQRSRIQKRWN